MSRIPNAVAFVVFIGLGVTPPNIDPKTAATNHSPLFQADDRALPVGVRATGRHARCPRG